MKTLQQVLEQAGFKYTKMTTPNQSSRYGNKIDVLGVHTMESGEGDNTAENVAGPGWFGSSKSRASSHLCGDNNSVVDLVPENMMAWTMPGVNTRSLNYECAGRASQGETGWTDNYSKKALEAMAISFAYWTLKYAIPVRRLTPAQLLAGERGICGHVDASATWHKSDHTDPGPTFPWMSFLQMVKAKQALFIDTSPSTAPVKTKSAGLVVDGQMGALTIRALQTALKVTSNGRVDFTTVKALQKWAGATQDGKWGPKTTKAIQKKLGVKVDGLFGPQTIRALQTALNSGKIK